MSVAPSIPERILVVRLGAIGDVVNALTIAAALKSASPRTHIGWAVHPLCEPLARGHSSVDAVHVWRRDQGFGAFRRLVGEIRAQRYDLAIDAQRILKSALLARASGAPRVLGFGRDRAKELSWLLTREHLAPRAGVAHMVEHYLDFVRALGVEQPSVRLEGPSSPAAAANAQAWIAALGAAPIVLHIGATKPASRWSIEGWRVLARRLDGEYDRAVCVVGGPSERAAGDEVLGAAASSRNFAGRTSLVELSELLRRSRVVVSCDSGPMHVARAVGCPVVALFGAADERRTGPFGADAAVVRTSPPCAPCGRRLCSQPSHVCMDDLRVDAVVGAVRSLLK